MEREGETAKGREEEKEKVLFYLQECATWEKRGRQSERGRKREMDTKREEKAGWREREGGGKRE